MFGFFGRKPKRVSLEEQLRVLAECGVALLPGRTIDELLVVCGREEYEAEPFSLLLYSMGNEVEDAPWGRWFSDGVWHCDTECIEGDGSYVRIAERMSALSRGELPIQAARDCVDAEGGSAWIEFDLHGVRRRFEPEINDDWVDSRFLTWWTALAAECGTAGRFLIHGSGGQDCLLGWATPEQRARLNAKTGMRFEWLT